MFDIDNFKMINDENGQAFGDLVLKNLAEEINKNTRKTDLLFRLGGDEFLLLARSTSTEQANHFTAKVSSLIQNQLIADKLKFTVSVGISAATENISSAAWMDCADKALYQAKNTGKNKVETYVGSCIQTDT